MRVHSGDYCVRVSSTRVSWCRLNRYVAPRLTALASEASTPPLPPPPAPPPPPPQSQEAYVERKIGTHKRRWPLNVRSSAAAAIVGVVRRTQKRNDARWCSVRWCRGGGDSMPDARRRTPSETTTTTTQRRRPDKFPFKPRVSRREGRGGMRGGRDDDARKRRASSCFPREERTS